MMKSKPKIVYVALFFFTLMVINIIYANLTNASGVIINGKELNIPVEIVILNAFMFGFALNILSGKIGKKLRSKK